MGDSRIVVSLIFRTSKTSSHDIKLPADSPLRNAIDHIHSKILHTKPYGGIDVSFDSAPSSSKLHPLTVYDCTYHPPKDITTTINQYDQTTGPKSITLQALGWFPSGKIVLFETDNDEAKKSILKSDVHYRLGDTDIDHNHKDGSRVNNDENGGQTINFNPTTKTTGMTMPMNGVERPLPSQMLETITKRHDEKNEEGSNSNKATHQRQRTEKERWASLDRRIKRLDATTTAAASTKGTKKKKANVSKQVQRILIKSRSEGDKKLRQEDRFYLETVLLVDPTTTDASEDDDRKDAEEGDASHSSSSYGFYSKFFSVGRVATSVANTLDPVDNTSFELLVTSTESNNSGSNDQGDEVLYKRLPNTMRLYEAEASGYIKQFDRVVIRVYDTEGGINATPSIT